MNQDQQELTLEESVKQVMQTLPPIIRDYLSRGKYTPIARSLMAKYGLRIDQGGILERGMMLLLMGIDDPAEFSKALAEEAKLDQRTINGIVEDVNTQIFMPLRDEMRKETPVAPAPAMLQSAAATPPRPLLVEVKPPQILVPAPPISPRPALRDVLASVMKAPLAPQKIVQPPTNLPDAPRPSEASGGGGMSEKPVVSDKAQGASSPVSLKPSTLPTTLSSAPPTQPAPPKPLTSYSTDPYREPIDEK